MENAQDISKLLSLFNRSKFFGLRQSILASVIDRLTYKLPACCTIFVTLLSSIAVLHVEAAELDTGWKVISIQEFYEFSFKQGDVTLNNFMFNENKAFMTSLKKIEFSVSGQNHGSQSIYLSIQVIGLSESGKPVFAFSAEPSFGSISAKRTEKIRQSFVSPSGELAKLRQVILRIFGDF